MNRQLRPSPERQQYRDARGRYTEMYRCELCGRPAGPNYRSDRRCNVYGIGVVLCPPCAALSETIPDDQYQAVYQKAAQYHSMFGRPLEWQPCNYRGVRRCAWVTAKELKAIRKVARTVLATPYYSRPHNLDGYLRGHLFYCDDMEAVDTILYQAAGRDAVDGFEMEEEWE